MRVTFDCGHHAHVPDTIAHRPTCPVCGEGRVRRVMARAPRFVGVATGPYCETTRLAPMPVDLAPQGPLVRKESP